MTWTRARTTERWRATAAIVMLAGTTACAHAESTGSGVRSFNGVPLAPNITCADARCSSYNTWPYVRTRSRYGIGCMGNVSPGSVMSPKPPPESYAVGDIAKPNFPKLSASEAGTVARIGRYVHSKALRIAWVSHTHAGEGGFIVFDALDGPCEVWAPGYPVLNGTCNEFYQPGENPYDTHGSTGCLPPNAHRPWMRVNR